MLNYSSISNYGSSTAPSWVQINTSTGQLSISAPSVSSDSLFNFYVTSLYLGSSVSVNKLIKLSIKKCQVQNWQKCSNSSISVWSTRSSDYTLNSGSCIIASDTAQALRIITLSILGASLLTIAIASLMNPAMTASLWSMINQEQLLFLLLLTRAFIPIDVQTVIIGAKFTLNIASYFVFLKIRFISSIAEEFDFKVSNQSLELLGINSNSSIYNIYPIIILALAMIPLHLFVFLIYKLMPKEEPEGRWKKIKALSIRFINRLFFMFTFGWYIRYIYLRLINMFLLQNPIQFI